MLPVVAIVGRPNVGKSTLLNAIARADISIVDPTPGVTRDRVAIRVAHGGRVFELVDTGGIGIIDVDQLERHVEAQIEFALAGADVFVFVVDVRDGVVPMDEEIAARLRRTDKPVVLAVNKADGQKLVDAAAEFYRLGLGEPIALSAKQRDNTGAVLDHVLELLPPGQEPAEDPLGIKIAIVGRPNAGKSTLLNTLADEPRVIVSEIPGTTRDSIDVRLEYEGQRVIAIDTAGIKKRSQVQNSVAFYGQLRAERAIRRADVVLLLIDASVEVGVTDKKIAALVRESKKPCVLVINKWDLTRERGLTTDAYLPYLAERMPGLGFAPASFISARDGTNVKQLMRLAFELYQQSGTRVATGELNRVIEDAWRRRKPKVQKNRLPRIYYATQVGVHPPTIALFVNEPRLFGDGYLRYLGNRLRQELPYSEVPIEIVLRKSGDKLAVETQGLSS